MEEKRHSQRHRVLKAGSMAFGGGVISCTVRNLSATGAALEVTSPVGIPDRFTLVLETENAKRPCRVIWRTEKRLGVEFE